MDARRLGALAGIVGPVLFATVAVVEGWLRPGYDSFRMYLSELALGPRGVVQIANLIAFGTSLLLFAGGLAAEFPDGPASRWGPRLIGISGAALIGAGLGVMDPLPTPLAQLSWHGWLHALSGTVVWDAWPIGCFVFAWRFQNDGRWRPLAGFTFAVGGITAVLAIVLKAMVWSIRLWPENPAAMWGGAVQRLAFAVWLCWEMRVALRLHAFSSGRGASARDAR